MERDVLRLLARLEGHCIAPTKMQGTAGSVGSSC